MAVVWQAGPLLSLASGVLLAVLGALLFRADPRKDWNRIFALLAVFWGIQIGALNLVLLVTDEAVAAVAGRVSLAFLVPLYFFLVAFAGVFPRPRPPFGTDTRWLAAAIVPGAATLLLLVIRPEAILRDIVRVDGSGTFTVVWGPLFPYLVLAPLYAAFYYALLVMGRRLREAQAPIERRQIAFVLAALALFVAYNTPLQLLLFGGLWIGLEPASEAQRAEATVIGLIMLAGLGLLAYLAWRLADDGRSGAGPARREAHAVLAVIGGAFLLGVFEGVLFQLDGPRLRLVGLIRVISVALIVYAISRYQLFDLHLRLRLGATAFTTALVAASLGAAAWVGLRASGASVPLGTILVGAVVVAVFVPLLRLAGRLIDRITPAPTHAEDLYLRKLDVYRASVEALSAGGGRAAPDEPALATLRTRLGLRPEDHDVVVRLVDGHEPAGPVVLRPGATVFGRYQVERLLGEGAAGSVFVARDTLLGRRVVLKRLHGGGRDDPAVAQRLVREARLAGQLNHPNIVAVFDVEQAADGHVLVLEHVGGGTLKDRLAAGPMAPEDVAAVLRDVLSGLEAAHARGIVHRDVKPDNILITDDGTAKMADFGVAALGPIDAETTLEGLPPHDEAPGAGTLAYMSPEQARGDPVDARSDLYAVGLLAYRLLTGRSFHAVEGVPEARARSTIAEARPPTQKHLAALPPAWRPLLSRALSPDPARRFPDAASMRDALA